MAKRTASGKPVAGAQRNQSLFLTNVVTFTGSTSVDVGAAIKKNRNVTSTVLAYEVVGLTFEDAGGAALVHRLASAKNANGTFTINASKETTSAGTFATATNPCTVRWTVLITH